MFVVLIGAPGCGKGTQGKIIVSNFDSFENIIVGDLVRKFTKDNPTHVVSSMLKEGKLLPDSLINDILGYHLKYKDKLNYLIDGFPRTIEQAKYLSNYDTNILVIFFDININILEKRILGRYSCTKCNSIYNKFDQDNNNRYLCIRCNSNDFIVRRNDDNIDTLNTRIKEYEKNTKPLLDYYSVKDCVVTIDAMKSVEQVSKDITKILLERGITKK